MLRGKLEFERGEEGREAEPLSTCCAAIADTARAAARARPAPLADAVDGKPR